MPTNGGNSTKGNVEYRFTENELEWEVDDADEDSDTDDEYDHDAAHLICLEMSKWKHFSIFFILSSLYSLVFIIAIFSK